MSKPISLLLLTLIVAGCAPNIVNKPRVELTPFEGFSRTAALVAIRIGAQVVCAKGDPGLRNEMLITLGPVKQYVEDQDMDGLIEWVANKGLDKLDTDIRNELYLLIPDTLDLLTPCKLAPTSEECKNFWTNAYGEAIVAAVNGCYKGVLLKPSAKPGGAVGL